jgi:hypothetical protein
VDTALAGIRKRFGEEDVDESIDNRTELSRMQQVEGQGIVEFYSNLENAYLKVNPNADLTTANVQKELGE